MMVRVSVAQRRKITAGDKMAGRHGNKGVVSRVVREEDMPYLADGTPVDIVLNPTGVPGRMNLGQVLEVHLGWAATKLGFRAITPVFDGAREDEIESELARAWMVDYAWKETAETAWNWLKGQEYSPDMIEDDDEVRRLYLEQWLGERGYDVYRLNEADYARHATVTEWLRDHEIDPSTVFTDKIPAPSQRKMFNENAIRACIKLWLHTYGVDNVPDKELETKMRATMLEWGTPAPTLGKQVLRDGKTGVPYDQPVTVGVMSMLKLHHLVEDKVHARSTGPYSLVTQQPLGGKAQFGGQRFGEMEVWALEAYGAAYTLQEMLTVKSDDVQGRVNAYEAIVKGEPIEEPSIPASFRVLVKELQSLGLAVEAVTDNGEVIKFGKDEEKVHPPKYTTGLMDIGEDLMKGAGIKESI
jgi:DNA-directed RNA polymerase subunit beta